MEQFTRSTTQRHSEFQRNTSSRLHHDWKRSTRATLKLSRPGLLETQGGQQRPQYCYHHGTMDIPVHRGAEEGNTNCFKHLQGLTGEQSSLHRAGASPALDTAAIMHRLSTERRSLRHGSNAMAAPQGATLMTSATRFSYRRHTTNREATERDRVHYIGPSQRYISRRCTF